MQLCALLIEGDLGSTSGLFEYWLMAATWRSRRCRICWRDKLMKWRVWMSHRFLASMSAVAVVVAVVSLGAVPAVAQTAAPRTAWGQPDLQGIWDFRTITPLQRPDGLAGREFLTEEEAANLEEEAVDRNERLWKETPGRTEVGGNVGTYNNFWFDRGTRTIGTRRTSLIVDPPNGKIPPLTPDGQKRADARREYRREHPADSWVDRSVAERCILGFNAGPPITPGGYNQNVQVFQTPEHVVLVTEMVHTARIVPLDGRPPLGQDIRQWSGDSRGHWEGDTLVVETTNFTDKTRWRGSTEHMWLVERFSRVDAGTLLYEFTVTDPETWTSSWTASIPMRRTDVPMYEYACHEGNYGIEGILAGHRADEKAAEAATPESR